MVKKQQSQAKASSPPRVYSYLRYSTKEQTLGDSERRQIAMTESFAKQKGLTLDKSLRLADRGVSAFRGRHRRKGALAAFLNDVESGQVPSGSYLVLENLDRLSREGFGQALKKIIYRLWDHGVILQTLSPEESYPPGCEDDPKFIGLWMYLNRAHEESVRKSERVREARQAARKRAHDEGTILTARCPAWLRVVDGRFVVMPAAAKTIQSIFDAKLAGVGVRQIAHRLNTQRGWWKPPEGWRNSYIRKILGTNAVIGCYQPYTIRWVTEDGEEVRLREPIGDAIPEYYPRIIDDSVFYAVQEQLDANKGKGGQTGKASNLFKHLVKCPYCGGPMHFIDKGQPPKGGSYLLCDNGRRGAKCSRHSIRYDEVERLILTNCRNLKPEAVLPNPNEQNKLCQSLRERIQGNEAKARDRQQQIDNLVDQIGRTNSAAVRDAYEAKVIRLEEDKRSIEQSIKQDRTELMRAEQSLQSFDRWQHDLKSLQKALANKDDVELRLRLNAHLRQLIEHIELFTDGFSNEHDDDGHEDSETIGDYLDTVASEFNLMDTRSKAFGQFVRFVVQRRMSKAGRFVRVFFTSGTWADFVPKGSIASGRRLCVDERGRPGWEFIRPDIGALWQDYEHSRGEAGRSVESSITL